MAWSLLQSVSTAATASGATSVSATFTTANLSSGSVIIASFAAAAATASAPTTPTATCGGTSMTLVGQVTANGGAGIITLVTLFALATPAGQVGTKPTVTGSWTNSATASIIVEEVSGILATVDGTAATKAQNTTGVQPATGSAYSTTAANEYLVSVYGDDGGPATLGTNSTGYTADANNVSANSHADVGLWHKNSSNGAETMSLALTGTVPVWGTILAAFQLIPIGATLTTPNLALAAPLLGFNVPLTTAALTLGAPPLYVPYHPLRVEMYTGAWQDVSSFVYQRDTVGLQRGRLNEASTMSTATATFTLNNRDGRFTTRNPVGAYYPNLVQNAPVRFSKLAADVGLPNYLRFEGDSTSYASAPDTAGLQISTGTLSVRIDVWPTDYQQVSLMAKYGGTAKSWAFFLNANGTLTLYTNDGSVQWNPTSTAPIPYYGQRIALRADYNVAGQTVTFYTASSMAGSWTQLGAVVTTGATVLSAGVGQPVQVGTSNFAGMLGAVYEAQVLATGVVKADPVFSAQTPGSAALTDAQGNTWTLTGTAEISDRLYRFHGEMGSYPKAADPSGQDVYSQARAFGVSKRLQNANTPAYSAMRRAYVRNPNVLAYWPCEDGSGAISLGSAVGGPPMTITGSPTLASFTGFASSSALPVFNSSTWTGAITDPGGTANILRFDFCALPAATGDANGAVVARLLTTGTVRRFDVIYSGPGVGGVLTVSGYDLHGNNLFSSNALLNGAVNGALLRVSAELIQSGGNVTYNVAGLVAGTTTAVASGPQTLTSATIGPATSVSMNAGFTPLVTSAAGHVSYSNTADNLSVLAGPLSAWSGETAGIRFARLCGEEGIACRIVGAPGTSTPMGAQTADTVYNLLQACEKTDLGMMFEPRQCVGLGYRTRSSMYHQATQATASYSAAQVYQGFASTGDTQLAINDVTAQAPSGSTARQQLLTGAMSVQAPPNGIGRIDTQIQPSPQYDAALNQIASWFLWVRSTDDDRYPSIPFQMARSLTPTSVALLDIGDYLQITGTPSWLPPGPVRQLVAGTQETLFPGTLWELDVNGIPEAPYETAQLSVMHLDTAGSQLTAGITSGATSFQVTTTAGPVWTQAGGDFPFDILVDGERMTVTNITSATSPQTFTVTRSVNGVVKAHLGFAAVSLFTKPILSL